MSKDKGVDLLSPIQLDIELEKQKNEAREKYKKLLKLNIKPPTFVTLTSGERKNVDDLTVDEQEEQFIKCALNPIYFIETFLKIFDQTRGKHGLIVPFILFDFQKDLINAYIKNDHNVANKYRQAGISTATCAYLAWHVAFNKNRSVAIIADKLGTAQDELMADVVNFIEGCPSWLVPKPTRKNTQSRKRYDNGSEIGAFAAKSGLRGYTPTLLFWDETAWTEKGDKFWESASPTMQTGGSSIFVSTPNGFDPVFYKTFTLAVQKKNAFYAIELYWFNDPRYNANLKWYKNKGKENELLIDDDNFTNEKRLSLYNDNWHPHNDWLVAQYERANHDERKINQEIRGAFLGSGDNFIASQYLNRILNEQIKEPILKEYLDANMWVFEEARLNEEYIMSIDVSSGHGEDYSTINILKKSTYMDNVVVTKAGEKTVQKVVKQRHVQVAEYYGKVSPQTLGDIAYTYGTRYNNAYTTIDITSGHGGQTVTRMFELGYVNIHYSEVSHKPSRDMLGGYVKKGVKVLNDGSQITVDLIPGFFIGSSRPSILIEFQRAIHMNDLIIQSHRTYEELKTFITVPGSRLADHGRSFHDDSIMGIAIGVYTDNFDVKKYNVTSKSLPEKVFFTMQDVKNKRNEVDKRMTDKKEKQNIINRNLDELYGVHSWLFK